MTDTSGSSFPVPRASGVSPEDVAGREFSHAKRGYAESEVRAFLRTMAGELSLLGDREAGLVARLRALEEQRAQSAILPSDQDLIAALGEETARVLTQARESAAELRGKAEEHARRVVREAQEHARELRASTQQTVETKTREAEDAARNRAKEIVAEARSLRERVLEDLNGRRHELERQIADLRTGRGRLVEAYHVVERALAHATRVMADEPSVAPETPTVVEAPPEPSAPVTPEPPVAEPSAPSVPPPATLSRVAEPEASEPSTSEDHPAEDGHDEDGHDEDGHDVGALFERLRSERTETPHGAEAESESALESGSGSDAVDVSSPPATPTPAIPETGDAERPDAAHAKGRAALDARDVALAETTDELIKRGKRSLQDEQNDILDGLRRQRGKIDVTKVLPPVQDQLTRWAHVLQPSIDASYAAGAVTAGGAATPARRAPRALLTELASAAVTPLRDRVSASFDSMDARTPADSEIEIAQRLGARYREWRGHDLELMLGDALAVAYSRGVFDAAPEGSRLRWVPVHEGKCPDCDDNALEPTVRGSEFPTGQPHPPAHPGCRCLLVVES
ncbi:MAG TPA: DivIVA domain-containing protein [Acidimicrobiia bacterium]